MLIKADIDNTVRHLAYGVQGLWQNAPSGAATAYGNAGYRFFGAMSNLLYRLQQLAPEEEARMTGRAYGAVAFSGVGPFPGDQIVVTLSGGNLSAPIAHTIIIPNPMPGNWSLSMVASALASAFQVDPVFIAAGYLSVAPYGSGIWSNTQVTLPLASFLAPNGTPGFNITAVGHGQTAPQVVANGVVLSPFISIRQNGVQNQLYGYLPICDYLESTWLGSSGQMAVNETGNVKMRHDEVEQREDLYRRWCRQMAQFLHIPVDNPVDGPSGKVCF